jgi:hypothetical protein
MIEKLVTEAGDLKHMNEYLEVHDTLTKMRNTIKLLMTRIMHINTGVKTLKNAKMVEEVKVIKEDPPRQPKNG